jgi:hypothetical protein
MIKRYFKNDKCINIAIEKVNNGTSSKKGAEGVQAAKGC